MSASLACAVPVQAFQVDAVECWLVQQPEQEDAPPNKAGGSVLDRCATWLRPAFLRILHILGTWLLLNLPGISLGRPP